MEQEHVRIVRKYKMNKVQLVNPFLVNPLNKLFDAANRIN